MKHNYIKTLVACFMAVAVFATSCQKDNGADDLGTGEATVTVNMKGIALNSGKSLRASASGKSIAAPAVQRQVISFNEQYNVTATLREVTPATPALRASSKRAEVIDSGVGAILPFTGEYTIVVKDGSGEEVATALGSGQLNFTAPVGNYTYIAYSEDGGLLWTSDALTVSEGQNTLDLVLKHKLTEVTVIFNSGSIGDITAIGGGTINPDYGYTDFDVTTGEVTYGATANDKAITFPAQAASNSWTSNPVVIAVEDTDNGTVVLDPVTINGITGDVSSNGWSLEAGVQYVLELNLGAKEVIDIGGSMWSPGNLTYNPDTEEYYFGESYNAAGDYWFPDRLLPKRLDGTNQGSDGTNGGTGDPCALVSSGSWRLPTQAEYQDLLDRTATGGVDNPGPNSWSAPARYVDHYDGTTDTDLGMFFGVLTDPVAHPGEDRDQYLFFPYGGYYPNDNTGETVGREAAYLTSATAGGYITFHLTGQAGNIGYGSGWRDANENEAVQIRCVQN